MPLLRHNALIEHPLLRNEPEGPVAWARYVETLNAQNVDSITIEEFLRVGDPAPEYDNGVGIWAGMDAGIAKLFIGDSNGDKLTWDGTSLSITGSFDLTNTTQTFTPTWTGFSSAPTGNINYMDLGKLVFMWRDTSLVGASSQTFMTISNVPSAIQPGSTRTGICMVADNSAITFLGGFNITGASLAFSKQVVSGSAVIQDVTGFTAANNKGLPAGWLIMYPK